jgi:hypothetical protein
MELSESLRVRDVLTKPRAAAAVLLASVAFAGCGNTLSANDRPFGTCGDKDYSKAETSHLGETRSQALATARQDVLTLQRRALEAGGSIDLPRYSGNVDTTEITAAPDSLTLNFARWDGLNLNIAVDHVEFPFVDHSPKIGIGAIMCFNTDTQFIVNGTFTSLRQYVHETGPLDK